MNFKKWSENRDLLSEIEKKLDILEEQMAMPGASSVSGGAQVGKNVLDDIKNLFKKASSSSSMRNIYSTITKRFNDMINRAKTPGEIAQLAKQKVDVSSALSNVDKSQSSGGL